MGLSVQWELQFQKQSFLDVANKTLKNLPLSLTVQAMGLRRLFPRGKTTTSKDSIWWVGEIAPNEYSRTYSLKLCYKQNSSPRVWVKTPNLKQLAGDRRLPHVYNQETQE